MLHVKPSFCAGVGTLTPTIFHESWWLDIATEGRCNIVEVRDNGHVAGQLPYLLTKKMGLPVIHLPPQTHFLGPAITRPYMDSLRRIDITKELIAKLPYASALYFKCHRDVQDVIAFQSAGFRASVQFTYEIQPLPTEILWDSLREKTRNLIRRAQRCHSISFGDDPASFMQFYRQSVESRGKSNNLNSEICTKLIQACLERGRGQIYQARGQSGNLAAALFCAWDNSSSYYLMTARDPAAHLGATSLLVWEAVTDAARSGLIFDFDGIINEGGARFAYNFTSNVAPRYIATRASTTVHLLHAVKNMLKPTRLSFN
jgi:hypothetical protein